MQIQISCNISFNTSFNTSLVTSNEDHTTSLVAHAKKSKISLIAQHFSYSQLVCIVSKKVALGRQKLLSKYITLYMRIRNKIEGEKGNQPLRAGEIHRNPAMIILAKFFSYVSAGSIGFRRVAVLAIGSVRKGVVDDRPFFKIFFSKFLALTHTDTKTEK